LAKQRWEEPSFIGGDRVPFFAVAVPSAFVYTKFSLVFNGEPVTSPSFEFLTPGNNYIFVWSADEKDRKIIDETINLLLKTNPANNMSNFFDYLYPLSNWITVEMNTSEPKRNGPTGNDANLIITLRDQLDFFVVEAVPGFNIYEPRVPHSPIFYGDVQDIETSDINALKLAFNPLPFGLGTENGSSIARPLALVGESRRSYLDFYVDE
jgi:hypothetical protein